MKQYVKDSNGKYKLVDRDQKEETGKSINDLCFPKTLSLEELDARLLRLERIVLDPRT